MTKGYFIEGDISDLINFKLDFNKYTIIDYDEVMITLFTHKISDQMIYIPFNTTLEYKDYKNNDIKSYIGAFTQDTYESIIVKLKFGKSQKKVAVHAINLNGLMYKQGQAKLKEFRDTPSIEYSNINLTKDRKIKHILKHNYEELIDINFPKVLMTIITDYIC